MADKDFRVKRGIHVGTDAYISNSITSVNSISFVTNANVDPTLGLLTWNEAYQTLDLGLSDSVSVHLGQDSYYYVTNQSGSTITKGTAVRAVGALGNSGTILISPAVANGTVESKFFIGLAADDIADGDSGYVVEFGKLRQANTLAFSAGDVLYLNPSVPGALSNTLPVAPNNKVTVALVINRSENQGILFVRPTFDERVGDLRDVFINGISDGQTIAWVSANSRFENQTISGGGASLNVALANSSNIATNVVSGVSTLLFDTDSGLDIVNLGGGNVKVQLNSTFKTWEVDGQESLIAEGLDNVRFVAGDGIAITTNALASPKSISFAWNANSWVNANDYSTLLSAYANDVTTLNSARANDWATYSTLSANDYATYLSAQANDGVTLTSARANDYNTLLAAYSNDGATLTSARANDYNTLLAAYSNDGAALLLAYANDYSTYLQAQSNDYATYLAAQANDYSSYLTLEANIYNTFAYLNANVGGGGDASNDWVNANDYSTYTALEANIYNTFAYLNANVGGGGDASNAWVNANDYTTYTTLNSRINTVQSNVTSISADGIINSETFTTVSTSNTFSLYTTVGDANNIIVSLSGIVQYPTLDYVVAGSTLTLSNVAPITGGLVLEVRYLNTRGRGSDDAVLFSDSFAVDGSTNAFTLSGAVSNKTSLLVYFDGLLQHDDTYETSGNTLTIANSVPLQTSKLSVRALNGGSSGGGGVADTSDVANLAFALSIFFS